MAVHHKHVPRDFADIIHCEACNACRWADPTFTRCVFHGPFAGYKASDGAPLPQPQDVNDASP